MWTGFVFAIWVNLLEVVNDLLIKVASIVPLLVEFFSPFILLQFCIGSCWHGKRVNWTCIDAHYRFAHIFRLSDLFLHDFFCIPWKENWRSSSPPFPNENIIVFILLTKRKENCIDWRMKEFVCQVGKRVAQFQHIYLCWVVKKINFFHSLKRMFDLFFIVPHEEVAKNLHAFSFPNVLELQVIFFCILWNFPETQLLQNLILFLFAVFQLHELIVFDR